MVDVYKRGYLVADQEFVLAAGKRSLKWFASSNP